MTDRPIVLFGAAGKTGRAVAAALVARGVPPAALRLVVRPGRAAAGGLEPGARVVEGDLDDASGVAAAVDGAAAVWLVAPNLYPDEVGLARRTALAATATGVRRVVHHSVLRPGLRAMPHHWHKLEAEEVLWGRPDLDVTVLQPSAYAQNLAVAVSDGALTVPYSVDVPFSLVDLAEVAEATARVLVEPGHEGAVYELAGPVVTVAGLARSLGLTARPVPPPDAGATYASRALRAMFDWYDAHGLPGNPRVLELLLGRRPRRAEEVLAAGG